MNWILVDSADKIYEARDYSDKERVMIFKHSHKCVISYTMKTLLQKEWHEGEMSMKTYFVNVIDNKELADDITREFGVEHHTPQVLILEKGRVVSSFNYGKILFANLKQFAN